MLRWGAGGRGWVGAAILPASWGLGSRPGFASRAALLRTVMVGTASRAGAPAWPLPRSACVAPESSLRPLRGRGI